MPNPWFLCPRYHFHCKQVKNNTSQALFKSNFSQIFTVNRCLHVFLRVNFRGQIHGALSSPSDSFTSSGLMENTSFLWKVQSIFSSFTDMFTGPWGALGPYLQVVNKSCLFSLFSELNHQGLEHDYFILYVVFLFLMKI